MVIPKIAICPICGKKTYLRIEDGGYLSEYPIRINCINCHALIKGSYVMDPHSNQRGLNLDNANIEECDVDSEAKIIRNADYVAEISGELPCKKVQKFDGHIIETTPFIEAASHIESMTDRITRLKFFAQNMDDWKRKKSTAFQLLDDGSIEYIAKALNNKMGIYNYECDHYLKALHCLQEVILEETKYLFLKIDQDTYISNVLKMLATTDKEKVAVFVERIGGISELVRAYRKTVEVFSSFMTIYPNVLPAETYLRFINRDSAQIGIATCTYGDLKSYYQDAYEALISLMHIPVCLDNISVRGEYQFFNSVYEDIFCPPKKARNLKWYLGLDNGKKINKICKDEPFQGIIDLPANRLLRNGIGHNNVKYDGITQTVTVFDIHNHDKVNLQIDLMDMAIDCIGLARSAVIYSEIILFILRDVFRKEGVRTIIHPRFYKQVEPNAKCPCGSNIKYKKCCKNDVDKALRS